MKQGVERLAPGDREGAEHAARLHASLLPDSPIARLGFRFMSRFYYATLVADGLICCDVAYHDGAPVGFIAYTSQPTRFMSEGLRRHWLALGALVAGQVLASPRRLGVILWTMAFMRGQAGPPLDPNAGELLSFGVEPDFRSTRFVRQTGRRIPVELFDGALAWFRAQGVRECRAVVEARNREALFFYVARGCRTEPLVGSSPSRMVAWCETRASAERIDSDEPRT
jgi:ribosomal protein S18 acetylase RimI-like enzyme